jgi:hypothetical protein
MMFTGSTRAVQCAAIASSDPGRLRLRHMAGRGQLMRRPMPLDTILAVILIGSSIVYLDFVLIRRDQPKNDE